MKLIMIAYNYPSKYQPTRGVFVKKIADEMRAQGVDVRVIAPVAVGPGTISGILRSVFRKNNNIFHDRDWVYRPFFFSASNLRFHKRPLTHVLFANAAKRTFLLKLRSFHTDAFYGHFLLPSGAVAVDLATRYHAASFIGLGEDNLFDCDKKILHHYMNHVSGIIPVSQKNKDYVQGETKIPDNKILLAPNSVSTELFYPRDKTQMRKKLNLPEKDFILAFVGFFEERKGVNRVLEAVKDLPADVRLLLIGEGPQKPKEMNDRILLCDKVNHKELPEYLSAADAFILPTLSEGSCNALVEAMACGLPVISSAIPEISSQVPEESGILVDPRNIQQLREAVLTLYSNKELRESMGRESARIISGFSIKDRIRKIISFMKDHLN